MTAQDLKNAVLQLAVQGKLTEQRVEEESFIGRFHEVSSGDWPFDVPESWTMVRLDDLVAKPIKRGKSPSYAPQGSVLVFAQKCNVKYGGINMSLAQYLDESKLCKYSEDDFMQEKDIVINCTGTGTLGRVGLFRDEDNPSGLLIVPDSHVTVIRAIPDIDPYYIYRCLEFYSKYLERKGEGSTNQKELKAETIKNLIIPLPPLAEQQRIVAKLEELLPHIEEYAAAEKRLTALNAAFPDKLRKSILQQAVMGKLTKHEPNDGPASELLGRIRTEKERLIKEGKLKKEKPLPVLTEDDYPFDIPDEWEWVRLTDVGEVSRGRSKNRPRNDPLLFKGGSYPFIQTGDVAQSSGTISACHSFYNDKGLAQSRMWPKGTLCLTIAANIGDVGILDFDACFPDSVIGFNAFSPIESNNYFLYMLMAYKAILDSRATKSAQKNINLETIASLAYPLPPLAEQQRIVERVEELLAVCEQLK